MKSGTSGIVGAILAAGLCACGQKQATLPSPPIAPPAVVLPAAFRELSPQEAAALIQQKPDLQILDMRVETEWAEEGHIAGAHLTNFYRQKLGEHLQTLDRNKPYFVYCALGERARLTAAQMAELGFAEVYLLKDGLNAWKKAGLPLVQG